MIKYIGSKRRLIPELLAVFSSLQPTGTLVDLFSGTSRVGIAAKRASYLVWANDINQYAHVLATCYVEAHEGDHIRDVIKLVPYLNSVKHVEGYVTKTFCLESRFFQPKNGRKIDGIREEIERLDLQPELKAIALTSLLEAADRVDSTVGVQMAYLKSWAKRSYNDLELRIPALVGGTGSKAFNLDALEAAKKLTGDIGYLDPPYNQHKYLGNYHIWESIVRWDKPEHYGVACKRQDCRERKSPFNSKPKAKSALKAIIDSLDVKHLVVSFNDEGYISREEIIELLSTRGEVLLHEKEQPRYVGQKLGLYNREGVKVGQAKHAKNKEYIFVVRGK